ncbi:glycoside hydrolase family 127 protein [Pelagovum pacificum]|uniref:Glycoside hydrolase family 127 protein n=1 Tax=Pelagovum pacificum TaxID=2588711 RepID=A0A5C5G8W0_9RHOB|nr:beta-L-arabinofuranosidase domain-containing protein [Pelagovum pacificum]QQA41715.1 glycoside hydrolase family 127 protein [Pelagovum pacificum]TNY30991.1 glycoside hydrolase family 127 protein [Pelagovum pacificum]
MDAVTDKATRQYRPPAIPDVELRGFWGERADAVSAKTVHILLDRCAEAGMFDQIDPSRPVPEQRLKFHRREGKESTVTTQMFWDSDVAKALEAAAYAVHRRRDPALEARVDEIIAMFAALQREDGYCNSWYLRMQPGKEWTNLRDCHELYCAGHLMEAAVAYHQATGKRVLLDVMCRYADLIDRKFGWGEDQMQGYCGHEEIELALIKLGREVNEPRYLELAKFFVDVRGQQPHYFDEEAKRRGASPDGFVHGTHEYSQSHKPVREQDRVVGHAVRAMYLYSGMADVATEFNDNSLTAPLETLWADVTQRQMYITGGIGPEEHNEGFSDPYHLPNDTAYAETCASIALAMWASRMLGRGPDREYADVMETAFYNGALSGLSMDGGQFFYENPLESHGHHHRWDWHRCPCCPPNIARAVTSIGTYMYGVADDALAVHLYGASKARFTLGGSAVTIEQETEYPWDGRIKLTIGTDGPARFALSLRLPGWCADPSVTLGGEAVDLSGTEGTGYVTIEREWSDGDVVTLDLPMAVTALRADPRVRADRGRSALTRGPLVYCMEGADNDVTLDTVLLNGGLDKAETVPLPALGDAVGFRLPVTVETHEDWGRALYRTTAPTVTAGQGTFVPYHLWDNREPGEMLVWLRTH